MLSSTKGRRKFLNGFYHFRDFEEAYASEISSKDQSVDGIYAILRTKGSPDTCHVVSTNSGLDGQELPLIDVLSEIVGAGNDGTFVSCIAGKLGYYEGESVGDRYILEKK